jgi:hypothetical protein
MTHKKLRMFPLFLYVTTFTWFTSLVPNSIFPWAQIEQKFHEYFYSGDTEIRLSHLTTIKQIIMSKPLITLGGLAILEIGVLI